MATIKKHLMTDIDHMLPTYKKLPPIPSPPPSRETDTKQSPSLYISAKSINLHSKLPGSSPRPVSKGTSVLTSASSPKNDLTKLANEEVQNNLAASPDSDSKTQKQKHFYKTGGIVADDGSAGDVKLIGYKTTSENTAQHKVTNGWSPPGSELPPCKVCGDKASGLHYGAYTCEACKAFFRRTLKRSTVDFQCTCTEEERKLGTDVARKTTCPKCRFERCVKVGMSKDAIKIGRYTITRKRQNDREVNMLKTKDTIKSERIERPKNRGISESSSSNSPYSSGMSISSPEDITSDFTPPTSHEDKTSRKRKYDGPEQETGMLYRSLTNSIFQSLLENQLSTVSSRLHKQKIDAEVSPMEQLYMQPYDPNQQVSDQITNSSTNFLDPILDGNSQQFTAPVKGGNSQQLTAPVKGGNSQQLTAPVKGGYTQQFTAPVKGGYSQQLTAPVKGGNSQQFSAPVKGGNSHQFTAPVKGDNMHLFPAHDDEISLVDEILLQQSETFSIPQSTENTLLGGIVAETSPIEDLLQGPVRMSNDFHSNSLEITDNSYKLPLEHDTLNEILASQEVQQDIDNLSFLTEGLETKKDILIPEESNSIFPNEMCTGMPNDKKSLLSKEGVNGGTLFDVSTLSQDNQLTLLNYYEKHLLKTRNTDEEEEIIDIVHHLVDMSLSLNVQLIKISCKEILQKHADYLEQYMLRKEVFGAMDNLTQEEYMQFYNQTGIDIDNRQEILIDGLKHLEESVNKLVKFSKVIPGFSDILLDDQVNLVKASRFEFEMINISSSGMCIKTIMNVTTTPWNKTYHVEEILKIFPKDYCTTKGEFSRQMWMLHLTTEEASVIKAIAITFPDRCVLKERDKVEAIHNKMVACLLHLLNQRHPQNHLEFSDILYVLLGLRDLASWEKKVIQDIFEVYPLVNNHQLLKEFVS